MLSGYDKEDVHVPFRAAALLYIVVGNLAGSYPVSSTSLHEVSQSYASACCARVLVNGLGRIRRQSRRSKDHTLRGLRCFTAKFRFKVLCFVGLVSGIWSIVRGPRHGLGCLYAAWCTKFSQLRLFPRPCCSHHLHW